jgi:hypothetical protein
MMFRLRRLDIWPTADLGVRRGYGLAWGVPTPSERELQPLGEPYRPYRTVLTWYCWKAAELYGQTRVAERGRARIPPDMVGGGSGERAMPCPARGYRGGRGRISARGTWPVRE